MGVGRVRVSKEILASRLFGGLAKVVEVSDIDAHTAELIITSDQIPRHDDSERLALYWVQVTEAATTISFERVQE